MIANVVAWSARHHRIILLSAGFAALAGELARRALPRDVVPDLSDPQVVLVAEWHGHPALDVARSVTGVLTRALDGTPGSTAIRGSSMEGMAFVEVVFGSAEGISSGRAAVNDRLRKARSQLPPGAHVQLGPTASSTGWVFQYALVDPSRRQPISELRRYQDEILRPMIAAIPGVAEVAAVGGASQKVVIEIDPDSLRQKGLVLADVVVGVRSALKRHHSARFDWLGWEPIPARRGATTNRPIALRNVAKVKLADDAPSGFADFGGSSAVVGGIVVARPDAHLRSLIERVRAALDHARTTLPQGVELVTVYDRSDLVSRVGQTLLRALAEEIGVVVLIVLLFLLHARSALVPLTTLPVVLLLTFAGMWILKLPATIMSLGGIGIALGMAVDADIVALEACHRDLEAPGASASAANTRGRMLLAAGSFTPAILISLVIAALSFLPVLAFTGETGRLLRPLALAKTLVILSAAIVAVTLAPALRDRLLRGAVRPEFSNPISRWLVRAYRPLVHFALSRPALTLTAAALAVISCVPIVSRLGGEFLPRLDEGDLLFMPTTAPGVRPTDAAAQLSAQDRAIAEFKEVATVFGKVGRADTATDPAPFSMAETTVRLRPPAERPQVPRARWYSEWAPAPLRRVLGFVWPEHSVRTNAELVEELDRAAALPGWTNAWTAPIRARIDMTATGVRTPVGIRIIASEPARLDTVGAALRKITSRVPGTRSAVLESLGGETGVTFDVDDEALRLGGFDVDEARGIADLLLTGGHVGEVSLDSGPRPAPVHLAIAKSGAASRDPLSQIRQVTLRSSNGDEVPLALLVRPRFFTTPAMVRTERGHLVAYVYVDLTDGTDPERYVAAARREVDRALTTNELSLAPGETIEWTGQYELLAAGKRRLIWIAPIVLLSMLGLLCFQFRSFTQALIVLFSVPFALVGSFWTLFLLGYRFSPPVWLGLLSVVGLAMQTGVVMVVYIDQAFYRRLREEGIRTRDDIVAAHAEGTVLRLRPKVMTITTMAASLLPLLWADGAGAEIMKRVAAPMIGGLATSAFLTLEVIPVIYTIWRHRQLRRAQRLGVSLERVVGTAPGWARFAQRGRRAQMREPIRRAIDDA